MYNLVCLLLQNSDFLTEWLDYNSKGGREQEPFYGGCVSFINQKLKPVRDCSFSSPSIGRFSMIDFFVNWISLDVRLLHRQNKTFGEVKVDIILLLFSSAKEVMFSPVSVWFLVGWFVSSFAWELLNGFPRNFDWGWVSAQNRPQWILVWIMIDRWIQFVFFSTSFNTAR